MTKPKISRPGRGGGARKLRRATPQGHRVLARPSLRGDGRSKNFVVLFEHVGEYYDDVLVSFEYDEHAAAATRALPSWAQHWDPTFKVWRIHPGYAERLAAALQDLGYTVLDGGD